MAGGGDKTEKATPKRREEARKIGRRRPRKLPYGFFVHLRLFLFQRESKKLLVDLVVAFYTLLMQALEQDF